MSAFEHEHGGCFCEFGAGGEGDGAVGGEENGLCAGEPVEVEGEGFGVDAFADGGVIEAGSRGGWFAG